MKELSNTIKIIESTAAARKRFVDIVTEQPSLMVMHIKKWAGVGAVWFVP